MSLRSRKDMSLDDNSLDDNDDHSILINDQQPATTSPSEEEGEEDHYELHSDIFTIMFVSPFLSWSFFYATIVYSIQLAILIFTMINILANANNPQENPMQIPLHTNTTVIMAQALALIVSIFSAKDIIHALDIFQIEYSYDEMIRKHTSFSHATREKWIISHILRSLVGILGTFIAFLFIVKSTEVLSLFLDFAAVQFVSELDSLGFYFAEKGFFLTELKVLTTKIKSIQFEEKKTMYICGTKRRIKTTTIQSFTFVLTLLALIVPWSYFLFHQRRGYYYGLVCLQFEIQFDNFQLDFFNDYCDEIVSDASTIEQCPQSWIDREDTIWYTSFNDVYEAQLDDDETVFLHNYRPVYHQRGKIGMNAFGTEEDSPPGKFEYCQEEKAWVFTIEKVNKGEVDNLDERCNWLMKSPETEAYSLHEVDTDGWIIWTGTLNVAKDFSKTCIECEYDRKSIEEIAPSVVECTYHGYCGENEACICDENWMGNQCETCSSCSVFNVTFPMTNITFKTSQFRRFDVSIERPIEVYGRPVYYKLDDNGEIDPILEVILFSGGRYVIWDLKENGAVDYNEDIMELSNFLNNFHSTWDFVDGTQVRYASELTTKRMPLHLKWANTLDETDEDQFKPIDFVCNSDTETRACSLFYNDFGV